MHNVSEVFATALSMIFLIFVFKQLQNKYLATIGGEKNIKFGWMEKNFVQYTLTMSVLESGLRKPITEELVYRLPLLLFGVGTPALWIIMTLWSVLSFGFGHWSTPRVFYITPKKIRNKLENSHTVRYFYENIENTPLDDVVDEYRRQAVKELDRAAIKKEFDKQSVIYVSFACIFGLVVSIITVWQQNIWYAVLTHCIFNVASIVTKVQSSYKLE